MSILLLFLVGAGAIGYAFRLIDGIPVVPNPDVMLAILIGIFFVAWTGAFMLFLHWRDQSRTMQGTVAAQYDPNLEGTVYGMSPGHEYQILRSFTDHYGNAFEKGERLRFKQRHFLPYHGGHTIVFEVRTLYLQEEQNREILDHFSEYIALIKG